MHLISLVFSRKLNRIEALAVFERKTKVLVIEIVTVGIVENPWYP